jgi:hypothetical protein
MYGQLVHLLRYNSMITKSIYDILGIVPNLYQHIIQENMLGLICYKKTIKINLYYLVDYQKIDKKEIIWKKVSDKEPQITWQFTKNNTLKKECFDMADSYTCVLGYMKEEKIW